MKRRDHGGFTLIEMIIVLAILSILAGAAVPLTSKMLNRRARKATRTELQGLSEAVCAFFEDTARLPADVEELLVRPADDPIGWTGPYLAGVMTDDVTELTTYQVDAWSRPYTATVDGDVLALRSSAEDGLSGTSDDIVLEIDVTSIRRRITLERLAIVNAAVARYNAEAPDAEHGHACHCDDEDCECEEHCEDDCECGCSDCDGHGGSGGGSGSWAPLPPDYAVAHQRLVDEGFLPPDPDFQIDAWGEPFVEDPEGESPVVRVTSTHLTEGA